MIRGREGRAGSQISITPTMLRQVADLKGGVDGEMFFVFLRAGELTVGSQQQYNASYHLNMADVLVDHPSNPSG